MTAALPLHAAVSSIGYHRRVRHTLSRMPVPQSVLRYEQAWIAGPECFGGKGWNLSRLHRFGFPVPRGGVVTSDVYRQVISDGQIARRMAELGDGGDR